MTLREAIALAVNTMLPEAGSRAEATWVVREILRVVKGWTQVDMIMKADRAITPWLEKRINDAARRVASGEPLQYPLGKARFMGMDFEVNPAVLIPRPETEQLVDMIADHASDRADLHVMDLGTGSGCIAIALARVLKFPHVEAIDISQEAIATALRNATALHARVEMHQADMLTLPPEPDSFDIIVSNPPYICEAERNEMKRNVLEHEPHIALFVPDNRPLLFYDAIAGYAETSLRHGGSLWLEINPLHAEATRKTVESHGLENAEIIKDERGMDRFIRAIKPPKS